MRWIVFGSKGWIGSYVTQILRAVGHDVIEMNEHFTRFADLEDSLQFCKPDRIVCAVGRTYGPGFTTIDYLEQPGKLEENLTSNLLLPVWIAQAAKSIPILYFGTGCIFEYTKEKRIFTEQDAPNFTGSSYSTVKGITDKLMATFPYVINARIRMPISDDTHPRDFITKLLGYSKITSIPNSMTVLSDIIPLLLAALEDGRFFGTVNAVNPGVVDHDWILQTHKQITHHHHEYGLETYDDQSKRLQSKRSNNTLDANLLQSWRAFLAPVLAEKYKLPSLVPTLSTSIIQLLEKRVHKDQVQ
jgi:3,5-epimerase/4-reductase